MTPQEIVLATLDAVEKTGFDYVIVGALAANAYCFARATKDVDFVLGVSLNGIETLAPHLPANFEIDPQPRMELLTGTHRWVIRIPGSDFYVEIFHLGDDPHHQHGAEHELEQACMPNVERVVATVKRVISRGRA